MVDRVSITIAIGGNLTAAMRADFMNAIQSEGLALDCDGDAFTDADFPQGQALALCAHEVAWGRADILEAFCIATALPFVRARRADGGRFGRQRRRTYRRACSGGERDDDRKPP